MSIKAEALILSVFAGTRLRWGGVGGIATKQMISFVIIQFSSAQCPPVPVPLPLPWAAFSLKSHDMMIGLSMSFRPDGLVRIGGRDSR